MDAHRCGGSKEKETSEGMKIAETCARSRFTIRSTEVGHASIKPHQDDPLPPRFSNWGKKKDSVRLVSDRVLVEFG